MIISLPSDCSRSFSPPFSLFLFFPSLITATGGGTCVPARGCCVEGNLYESIDSPLFVWHPHICFAVSVFHTNVTQRRMCRQTHAHTNMLRWFIVQLHTHTCTHTHTSESEERRCTGKLHQVEWQVINQTSGTCNSDLSRQRSSQQCYHTLHRSTLPRPSGDPVCLCESLCVYFCV